MVCGLLAASAASCAGSSEDTAADVPAAQEMTTEEVTAEDTAAFDKKAQEVAEDYMRAVVNDHSALKAAKVMFPEDIVLKSFTTEDIARSKLFDGLEMDNGVQAGGFKVDKSKNGNIILTSVTPGMAADKQGLKVNDEIIAIDGVSIAEQTYEKYARKILGKPDTEVKLTILRDGKEFEINFKRVNEGGKIIESKKYGSVGCLRIKSFSDFTIGQLDSSFDELGNVKGLVIDLRGNLGGVNSSVIDVASKFISSGTVKLKRFDGSEEVLTIRENELITEVPIVVLVNENTASAAEIMTALLKNNKQGCRLVGVNTYGKGIFQQEAELKSGGTVHYTAGKFYVDDRENWNGVGITPDVVVEMDSKLIGTDKDIQLKKAIELLD